MSTGRWAPQALSLASSDLATFGASRGSAARPGRAHLYPHLPDPLEPKGLTVKSPGQSEAPPWVCCVNLRGGSAGRGDLRLGRGLQVLRRHGVPVGRLLSASAFRVSSGRWSLPFLDEFNRCRVGWDAQRVAAFGVPCQCCARAFSQCPCPWDSQRDFPRRMIG